MAKQPSKRNRPKLEPISMAELEADTTMVGFTSLFRIPTTQAALPHVAAALEQKASAAASVAEVPQPTVGPGAITEPTAGAGSQPTVGHATRPTVGAIVKPTVGVELPFFQAADGKLYPRQRVRPLLQPQDALSAVELRVFESLERLAAPLRTLRIGYDRLAENCSLNEKSVRLLLQRLQDKGFLTVEEAADPTRQLGKRYRLHSMEEARWLHQQRDWQWVVRSGNGILIVHPIKA